GYQDLRNRACVVINHVAAGETNVAVNDLVRHFEQQVQPGRLLVLPWDKHIAAGTEIQLYLLDPLYKRRGLELAAAPSDDFQRAGRRGAHLLLQLVRPPPRALPPPNRRAPG